jgi:hypothetical protein
MADENKVTLETAFDVFMNLQNGCKGWVVFFAFLALIGLYVLIMGISSRAPIMGVGGLAMIVSFGLLAYNKMKDKKCNQTCNVKFWNTISSVDWTPPEDFTDVDLDISLCKAQTKAEYQGRSGFYYYSNTETVSSNVDVYYIESGVTKLTANVITPPNYNDSWDLSTRKTGDDKVTVTIVNIPDPNPPSTTALSEYDLITNTKVSSGAVLPTPSGTTITGPESCAAVCKTVAKCVGFTLQPATPSTSCVLRDDTTTTAQETGTNLYKIKTV